MIEICKKNLLLGLFFFFLTFFRCQLFLRLSLFSTKTYFNYFLSLLPHYFLRLVLVLLVLLQLLLLASVLLYLFYLFFIIEEDWLLQALLADKLLMQFLVISFLPLNSAQILVFSSPFRPPPFYLALFTLHLSILTANSSFFISNY